MDIPLQARLEAISTLIFDVDGVFTNNTLLISDTDVIRIFNARDGFAVQTAVNAGFRMAIITGGKQDSMANRLKGLGITDVFYKVPIDKKLEVFEKYITDNQLDTSTILFMGDDIPDLLLMRAYPMLKVCPNDAVPEVKAIADIITNAKGGHEAVREIIELVMKAQNKWIF